ncbi:copper chaperone PCu(A)C [Candidatus Accumulibacter phosphatis]|uniref:Copper chaperone PCu(A)C n=2 Tax=Candidatus Accumulibacter TaxID=327159 RepID=A0ABX1U3I4_9PROT|nr:copper chaperone PCu(A)C [Candidatus Accumulibacter phosphatis]NMQ29993.1 copper chaperone PCu(A)C [Candidatus Accumulibacter phosphatis]
MSIAVSNRRLARIAAALLILGAASAVHAQVRVDGAWARATVPSQSATGAFMRLTADKDVVLTGVSSPVARVVEVHEMSMDKDIMRMRAVDQLPLKAGQTNELKSGGLHIMMMGLKKQIKVAEVVPLTLSFKAADGRVSTVEANAMASFAPPER